MAELASTAYNTMPPSYMYPKFPGGSSFLTNTLYTNSVGNTPYLYKLIHQNHDLQIWKPFHQNGSTPDLAPVLIVGRGSGSVADYLLDGQLFFDYTTGTTTAKRNFDHRLHNKIQDIQHVVYGDPSIATSPKYFIGHSLSGAYMSRAFHYFTKTASIPDTNAGNRCYMFNPYILIDDDYNDIIDDCKTDAAYKAQYITHMVDADVASCLFSSHGFGTINIWPKKYDLLTEGYFAYMGVFNEYIKQGFNYLHSGNHSIMNFASNVMVAEAMESVPKLQQNVLRSIGTKLHEWDITLDEATVTDSQLFLDSASGAPGGVQNMMTQFNYPSNDHPAQYFNVVVTSNYTEGEKEAGLEHLYDWSPTPLDVVNTRRLWFSKAYRVTNVHYGDVHYCLFFQRSAIVHNEFYVGELSTIPSTNIYPTTEFVKMNNSHVLHLPFDLLTESRANLKALVAQPWGADHRDRATWILQNQVSTRDNRPRRSTALDYYHEYIHPIISTDTSVFANFTLSTINTDNTRGSAGYEFYLTQTYTAQTRGVELTSFVPSAWTGWTIDTDLNPPDEQVFKITNTSYGNHVVKIESTLPAASLGVFGQALDVNNPLDDNTLTHPAHSYTWFQLTDAQPVFDATGTPINTTTQFTALLRAANKSGDTVYYKFIESSSSANNGTAGWYGSFNYSTKATASRIIFKKL